jgi:hypothetical protein
MNTKLRAVVNDSRDFLLPPHTSAIDRADAKDHAAGVIREAISHLIQSGHDDLSMAALNLAQRIEARTNV